MTFKSRLASSEPPTAHTEVIGRATGRQTHLGEASVYVTNIGRHDPEGGDGGVEFDLHAPNRTAGNTVSRDRPPPGPRSVGGSHVPASDATQRVSDIYGHLLAILMPRWAGDIRGPRRRKVGRIEGLATTTCGPMTTLSFPRGTDTELREKLNLSWNRYRDLPRFAVSDWCAPGCNSIADLAVV